MNHRKIWHKWVRSQVLFQVLAQVSRSLLRSAVEAGGFPQCSHPLLSEVVVLRAEDDALLTGVGEKEHQACSLALIQLKILLQK